MSQRNTLLLILFIFLLSNCKKTSNESATPSFKLEFEDDFSGTYVDQSKWSLYNSPGNAGFGLRRPEAFSVVDGNLIVTAQMVNGMLVSGGMCRKTAMTYGKYEFKVRTENDTSESTSGVILTWPLSNRCPEDGENDMYETGTDPNRSSFHTFIHYGTSPHTQYLYEHSVDATKWQIVSMEWTRDYIKVYRNSELVWVVTDQIAIPDVPHVVCIQLDAWKQTMSGTVRMYVDWIKVYSLEN